MAILFRGIKSSQRILATQKIVFYAKMAARIISGSHGGKVLYKVSSKQNER
jgi:hypothetical protein